jgi:hypothetical protein
MFSFAAILLDIIGFLYIYLPFIRDYTVYFYIIFSDYCYFLSQLFKLAEKLYQKRTLLLGAIEKVKGLYKLDLYDIIFLCQFFPRCRTF